METGKNILVAGTSQAAAFVTDAATYHGSAVVGASEHHGMRVVSVAEDFGAKVVSSADSFASAFENMKARFLDVMMNQFSGGRGSSGGNTVTVERAPAGLVYDPRNDTCFDLPFLKPDPSLRTTDPFYLAMGAQPFARGAIVKRPTLATIAERGGEAVVTPAQLAEFANFASSKSGGGDTIVKVYLGNREVTDLVMKQATSKLYQKGFNGR
jgi:D-alanyl-D-alanine carboxypeptidase